MTADRSQDYLLGLVDELRKLPKETEWLEFKRNRMEPEEIGEYISALANSAALSGKANAYLIWGVDDQSHGLVGTDFAPSRTKVGNEELESWLLRLLGPKIHFTFYETAAGSTPVVLLEIGRAFRHPVTNSSLRDRFGISAQNSAMASRILREAVEAGIVKVVGEGRSKKYMEYVPFWA